MYSDKRDILKSRVALSAWQHLFTAIFLFICPYKIANDFKIKNQPAYEK